MDKVIIERIPKRKNREGAKRWIEKRGEFVQISFRETIGHLAFFEIKKGFSRGSHYHKKKEEVFYVVTGSIRAVFIDMENGMKKTYILKKGYKVRVKTLCGHTFYGIEDALVVEYSPQFYDKNDSYQINFGV